jgi:hypothetical protein
LPTALAFRSVGAHHLGDHTVWQALKRPYYQNRYIAGTIRQDFRKGIESQILGYSSGEAAQSMQRLLQEQDRLFKRFSYVVPKPMAVTILVIASGFPRRGDILKSGVDIYAVRLLEAAMPLLEYAQRVAKVKLSGGIRRADEVLRDVQLPIDGRRVVAAEHLISWVDGICQGYTHYARLASMEYFGIAGSTIDNITPEYQLPKIRRARLPYVPQFRTIRLE